MSGKTIFVTRQHKTFYRMIDYVIRNAVYIIPAFFSVALLLTIRLLPAQTIETVYSRKLFPKISYIFGILSRYFPFSLGGTLLLVLSALTTLAVLALPFLLIFSRHRMLFLSWFIKILAFVLPMILLLFTISCAPNYYRLPFAEQSGLVIRNSSVAELEALCSELIDAANTQRRLFSASKVVTSNALLSQETLQAFNTLQKDYPFVGQVRIAPKPMPFSKILSIFNLTGFYFPYTAEANVNVHMPDTELAFTMAHELAHTAGFMREDEANFIGYLACIKSSDAKVRYSGLYVALTHSMNALYRADHQRFFALRAQYGAELSADDTSVQNYWTTYFDTPAAEVSKKVNDIYLKANNLSDGTQSYGRMVDLLLAQYRNEHNLT